MQQCRVSCLGSVLYLWRPSPKLGRLPVHALRRPPPIIATSPCFFSIAAPWALYLRGDVRPCRCVAVLLAKFRNALKHNSLPVPPREHKDAWCVPGSAAAITDFNRRDYAAVLAGKKGNRENELQLVRHGVRQSRAQVRRTGVHLAGGESGL